jgi:hypothetical protein
MERKLLYSFGWAFVVLLIMAGNMNGDHVKRVMLETTNGIVATAWTERAIIKKGEDIRVHFSIKNGSKNMIYVVSEPVPRVHVDTVEITVLKPLPPYDVQFEYDFSFHNVKPGQTHTGNYVIPFERFKSEGLWNVNIGLAYVVDKSGIDRKRREGEDPIYLIGTLLQRGIGMQLGSLDVAVRN